MIKKNLTDNKNMNNFNKKIRNNIVTTKYTKNMKININKIKTNIKNNRNKKKKIRDNIFSIIYKMKAKNNNYINKKNRKFNSIDKPSIKSILTKTLKMKKGTKNYNDYELNELDYHDALKLDRRTFSQLYISLLKTNHILIFSFFHMNDYNSYMIKIYMFFLTFAMNYVVSAMFYSDSTMHQIYVDDGSFDIAYQLPQMFYSFIISSVLGTLLNFLGLYEGDIAEFKKIQNKKKIKEKYYLI